MLFDFNADFSAALHERGVEVSPDIIVETLTALGLTLTENQEEKHREWERKLRSGELYKRGVVGQ